MFIPTIKIRSIQKLIDAYLFYEIRYSDEYAVNAARIVINVRSVSEGRTIFIPNIIICEKQIINRKKWVIVVDSDAVLHSEMKDRFIISTYALAADMRKVLNSL